MEGKFTICPDGRVKWNEYCYKVTNEKVMSRNKVKKKMWDVKNYSLTEEQAKEKQKEAALIEKQYSGGLIQFVVDKFLHDVNST